MPTEDYRYYLYFNLEDLRKIRPEERREAISDIYSVYRNIAIENVLEKLKEYEDGFSEDKP